MRECVEKVDILGWTKSYGDEREMVFIWTPGSLRIGIFEKPNPINNKKKNKNMAKLKTNSIKDIVPFERVIPNITPPRALMKMAKKSEFFTPRVVGYTFTLT